MSTARRIMVCLLGLFGLFSHPAFSASAVAIPSRTFELVGATFDDGGTAAGQFSKYPQLASLPLPEFYNIWMTTSAGANLPGAIFAVANVCYNNKKEPVCAPGANLLVSLDTGVAGQPGYDHFQLATYFAPNALAGQIGVLDPTFSYETACINDGCFTRHITSGAIRLGTQ
jgi:hypothetical protein